MTLPASLAPNAYVPRHVAKELDFAGNVSAGVKNRQAKLIQERLCLAGFPVAVDGEFGDATTEQLQRYQKAKGLPVNGVYGAKEHEALTQPFVDALNPVSASGSFGDVIIRVAKQHAAEHPVEVGGPNAGPWVRMYMDGNEGEQWLWCAGFVFFVMAQAGQLAGKPMPMAKTFSVDTVAERAKNSGQFFGERQAAGAGRRRIAPGSLFMVRHSPIDWTHVGIVATAGPDTFDTYEGNTDNAGSSNGFEATRRVRNYAAKDFVIW
jgi:peptidoglycan hydrolase-like protein with peptidoglycan-binding domain